MLIIDQDIMVQQNADLAEQLSREYDSLGETLRVAEKSFLEFNTGGEGEVMMRLTWVGLIL